MKRIVTFALLAVLLVGLMAPMAYAAEDETTAATNPAEEEIGGWMSDGFQWKLEDGTLTITGYGAIPGDAPWREYAQQIERIHFGDGVATVGAGTFRECLNLKEIHFGSSMQEIGDYAFQGCTAIEEIRLPDTFRRFGVACFEGCTSLMQVYCDGYMPNFRTNCLWNGTRMYIYYAPEKPWGIEYIEELERNFGKRLEVLCQDGTDPIPNEEGEAEPLAPVEKETLPPETTPPTVPETEPPTQPPVVTVPETTVPVPVTQPTAAAEPAEEETEEPLLAVFETTEPEIEEETVKGGFMGLALVIGVLTFFIMGALIFKIRSRRGKY